MSCSKIIEVLKYWFSGPKKSYFPWFWARIYRLHIFLIFFRKIDWFSTFHYYFNFSSYLICYHHKYSQNVEIFKYQLKLPKSYAIHDLVHESIEFKFFVTFLKHWFYSKNSRKLHIFISIHLLSTHYYTPKNFCLSYTVHSAS